MAKADVSVEECLELIQRNEGLEAIMRKLGEASDTC